MDKLKIVIAKGRIFENVAQLFKETGFKLSANSRNYMPVIDDPEIEVKIMKPQNIAQLIELGAHDVGFTGYDWIVEHKAQVGEIMDLGFDPVRIIAAIPCDYDEKELRQRKILVASEYETISKSFLDKEKYDYHFIRSFGATEAFPPQDADMIVDNISSGQTLKENNLKVIATVMHSSTRFIANRDALQDPWKKEKISMLQMFFQSVLDARIRVMLEMNVPGEQLEKVVKILPCMRSPTISPLYQNEGFAIKVAVKKDEVVRLIPRLKKLGASDILEYSFQKVMP